jgi:protein involved in polysaccharide export with SLBB domain
MSAAPEDPRAGLADLLQERLSQPGAPATHRPPAPPDLPPPNVQWPHAEPPLSPGDRIRVTVADGEALSGIYEVDLNGTVRLPFLSPVAAAGSDTATLARALERALVADELYRVGHARVSIQPVLWAAIEVSVSGAVFEPGRVLVNHRSAEDRAQQSTQASGDYPPERDLTAALRAAGGVRPDADLARVRLIRGADVLQVDLRGLLDGAATPLLVLAAGDRVVVPSSGQFQAELVRPSQITPPGVRVFLSNLTVPAASNSNAAVNRDATRLPYGTRLLTATMAANCVGGTGATNARRYAVLVTRNPVNGRAEVLERSIEQLLREPAREALNPHLMPGDGVACYDSGVTNLRDLARGLSDVLIPLGLLGLL